MEDSKTWNQKHFQNNFKLSELDKQILEELQNDGTLSYRKLSQLVGKNINTVKKRVELMKDNGIILRTSAIIDCCKIGFHEMLIISLRVNSSSPIMEIFSKLENIRGVNSIYQVSGQFPILIIAKCVSKEDQIDLLEKIKKIPGIEELVTQVVMRKVKEDFRLHLP